MTERKLIPCPICHGSTKEIQGVLACIANCRTQFYGLAQDKWYVGTQEELDAALEKIKTLEHQLAHVTEFVGKGYDTLVANLEAEVADLKVIPQVALLRRCVEISYERGFARAVWAPEKGVGHRKIDTVEAGTVIRLALEELLRENPDMFKGLTEKQFT